MNLHMYKDRHFDEDTRDLKHRLKITVINSNVLNDLYRNALLCDMSYRSPNELRSSVDWNSMKMYTHKEVFLNDRETDTQGYIWIKGNVMHLAFRGTDSLKDAVINLDLKQETVRGNIKVHSGFYRQYKSVEDAIFCCITPEIKYINVTGHSLGGAVACVASVMIADRFKDAYVTCCTFGCPRVGNLRFKEFFKANVKNYYRVHMNDDPISMVPSLYTYHHVCRGICIDDISMNYKKDIKWYNRFFHCIGHIDYINPFEGHRTSTYVDRIKAHLIKY